MDFYVDDVLKHARVIVIDHLGGEAYWPYGIESITTLARKNGQMLVMFSGDLQEDPNLVAKSTAEPALCDQLWRYLREGGAQNAEAFLRCIAYRALGYGREADLPTQLPAVAIYHPARQIATIDDWKGDGRRARRSRRAVLPRASAGWQHRRIRRIDRCARSARPESVADRDGVAEGPVEPRSRAALCADNKASLVLNTTSFAAGVIDDPAPFELAGDAPVLQVILSSGNREDWVKDNHGLNSRDIAMHIALPEVDGRIITRAISFKGLAYRCRTTQVDVVRYQPDLERVGFSPN